MFLKDTEVIIHMNKRFDDMKLYHRRQVWVPLGGRGAEQWRNMWYGMTPLKLIGYN